MIPIEFVNCSGKTAALVSVLGFGSDCPPVYFSDYYSCLLIRGYERNFVFDADRSGVFSVTPSAFMALILHVGSNRLSPSIDPYLRVLTTRHRYAALMWIWSIDDRSSVLTLPAAVVTRHSPNDIFTTRFSHHESSILHPETILDYSITKGDLVIVRHIIQYNMHTDPGHLQYVLRMRILPLAIRTKSPVFYWLYRVSHLGNSRPAALECCRSGNLPMLERLDTTWNRHPGRTECLQLAITHGNLYIIRYICPVGSTDLPRDVLAYSFGARNFHVLKYLCSDYLTTLAELAMEKNDAAVLKYLVDVHHIKLIPGIRSLTILGGKCAKKSVTTRT